LAGRHLAAALHDRAGAGHRAVAHLARRHEHGAAADEGVVADHGAVLVLAVVVGGDRAGADVRLAADAGVAAVTEVLGLRAGTDPALLHLDEVADLGTVLEHGLTAQLRERTDLAPLADHRAAADHGARQDPRVAPDPHAVVDERRPRILDVDAVL